jgi:hypothetical protein
VLLGHEGREHAAGSWLRSRRDRACNNAIPSHGIPDVFKSSTDVKRKPLLVSSESTACHKELQRASKARAGNDRDGGCREGERT